MHSAGEGVPTNILALRLKHLEQAGIIERYPSTQPRSRYEYRLTEAGLRLAPAVRALAEWGHAEIDGTLAPPPPRRRSR
jgi:DNA-binding HxlR family transcriptional regulator